MPLYMDIHTVDPATTWEDVAQAHLKDVEVQGNYDVDYKKYWYNRDCGKLFCLVEAPNAEAAHCVHNEAHGLTAEKLIEVDPALVDGFMGHSPVNSVGAALMPGEDQRDSGVRAVMFTDIVGSTEITSKFGDDAAVMLLKAHNEIVRSALKDNRGAEVKHTGDGIMACFLSAAKAVRSARQIQEAIERRNAEGIGHLLTVRIGISAGEPVEDADDLFGSTVQLAARLCASAKPGEVLVSSVITDLCLGKGLMFQDAGSRELKGFEQPVHTHAVQLTG